MRKEEKISIIDDYNAVLPKPTADDRLKYLKQCVMNNRLPSLVLASLTFVMECLMIFFFIAQPYIAKGTPFFPLYIYLYVSMVILCPIFLVLLHVFKKYITLLHILEVIMVLILCVWSAIFSGYDVNNGFSPYLFIQFMVINSLAFHFRPLLHCGINVLSYTAYLIVILYGKLSVSTLFAQIINPLFMMIVSCVLVIMAYRIRFKSYLNRKLITIQNEKLEFFANNDFLTKIPNRKSIIEYLENIKSSNYKITCMMVDIDNFKIYNDTYGHIYGDECLIRLATVMNQYVLQQGGRIGRYGGEEFLAVFTNKNEQEIRSIADELVKVVSGENVEFVGNGDNTTVTISIGVYIHNDTNTVDKKELIKLADNALYIAKNQGRNQVSIYNDRLV